MQILLALILFCPFIAFGQSPEPVPVPARTASPNPNTAKQHIESVLNGMTSLPVENPCSKERFRQDSKWITTRYSRQDVTGDLISLSNQLKQCKSKSNYGIDLPHLESLAAQSRKIRYDELKDQIEADIDYRKVDDLLTKYAMAAKAVGISDSEIAAAIKKYTELGMMASAREKNSCKPIDMSPDFGPVRDQDSMGWCYAFTASDLLSYKLKQKISAADISFSFSNMFLFNAARFAGVKESSIEGGIVSSAIDDALEKGLCLEKDFPSEDNISANIADNLNQIERLRREYDSASVLSCDSVKKALATHFPNLKTDDVQNILKTASYKDLFFELADKTCHRIKAKIEVEEESFNSPKSTGEYIDSVLDSKRPAAISYNGKILHDKNAKEFTGHASIIVARRFNEKTGSCEYLVRNSWGRGCDSYDFSYECTEGNIWIPKSTLIRNTRRVITIK